MGEGVEGGFLMIEEIGRVSFIRMRIEEWKETDPLLEDKKGFFEFIEASDPGKVRVKDTEAWLKYQKEAKRKRITVRELLFDKARVAIPPAKKVAKKQRFQVITECPVHLKPVYLIIEALSPEEAGDTALGMRVSCPWGGIEEAHDFVVEKVLGVSVYPWKPPVTVSSAPIPSVEVKEMITSELGERFWILSRKGTRDFEEIQRGVEEAVRLTPVPAPPARGAATAGSVMLVLLLLVAVSAGGYYLWKRFKSS